MVGRVASWLLERDQANIHMPADLVDYEEEARSLLAEFRRTETKSYHDLMGSEDRIVWRPEDVTVVCAEDGQMLGYLVDRSLLRSS